MYEFLAVGSDAEVFLKNKFTGYPMTAIGLIGGTKEQPKVFKELGSAFFALQEDNVMAEMNIPPAADATEFVYNMNLIMDHLAWWIQENDAEIHIAPALHFTGQELEHPQAKHLGCEPDYCVWTRSENKIDKEHVLLETMRTAGGHIHISYLYDGCLPESLELREWGVKANDLFLGVPSVLMDKDIQRKQIYGKAGAFRPKDYGHEYRVLSNFWLSSNERMKWAFSQAKRSIEFLNEKDALFILKDNGDLIQKCINDQDVALAKNLCEEFGLIVVK